MRPAGVTQYRLAKDTGLSPIHISHIIRGKRGITAETGIRLSQFSACPPHFGSTRAGALRSAGGRSKTGPHRRKGSDAIQNYVPA